MMQFEMVGEELKQHTPEPPMPKAGPPPPPPVVNLFPGRVDRVEIVLVLVVDRAEIVPGLVKTWAGAGI